MRHSRPWCLSIQPLPTFYDCNDYHVIFFIEGHPEYESMEAMIKEDEEGGAVVRAIITLLDKTQVDHTNDPELLTLYKKRRVHFAPVRYERSEAEGRTRILVGFTSFRGEDIQMELQAASPASSEHARLFNPLGHSRNISLPVMYPERVALLDPKGTLRVGPLRFQGGRGYYSENFRIGVLRASSEQLRVHQVPSRLEKGEKWVYESTGRMMSYEIRDVRDGLLRVEGRNELLTVEATGRSLALREVSSRSSSRQRKDSSFSIAFSPGLPISPSMDGRDGRSESLFSIAIDDRASLVTGTATSQWGHDGVKLVLDPAQPGWAAGNKVSTSIRDTGGGLSLETEILA
jgi:hypothetical protein